MLTDVHKRFGKFQTPKTFRFQTSIEPAQETGDCVSTFEKGELRGIFIFRHTEDGKLQLFSDQILTTPRKEELTSLGIPLIKEKWAASGLSSEAYRL